MVCYRKSPVKLLQLGKLQTDVTDRIGLLNV
jgi:hypothetical protein